MSEDKVVIVKGIAGLGNRLRVVAAAIDYAEETGRKIYIDWCDGVFAPEGTNAFNKYFKISGFPAATSMEELDVKTFYPSVYSKLPMNDSIYNYFEKEQIENRYVRKGLHYLFKIAHKVGDKNKKLDTLVCNASQKYQAFVLIPEYKDRFQEEGRFAFGAHLSKTIAADAVIYCDNIPFYREKVMRKHIKLKREIAEKVKDFTEANNLTKGTVGVHIRANGKECYGDISKLVGKLDKFVKEKGLTRIFLCTDNADVEALFKNSFPDQVITQPKYLPKIEAEETGIHDYARDKQDEKLQERLTEEAVIDMFALSRCEYLLYHSGSTFSEISRAYHRDKTKCKSWLLL